MALPQWRDVNAPNFSGAADSLQMFSQLLNQGLSTAKSTFREFDQSKSDEVNHAIEMRLAQIQDPDQARAQAAAILAGANKDRISSAMISAIGRRPGEVQQQALTDLNFNKTRDQFADDAKWKAAFSAAAPELAALEEVRKGGDFKAINAAQEKVYNALAKGGASAERIYNFAGQLDGRVNSGFDMMSGRTNFDRGTTRWGWDVQDREAVREAENIGAAIASNNLTAEDAAADLNQRFQSGKLSARTYMTVRDRLGLPGLIQGDLGGGGGVDLGTGIGGPVSGLQFGAAQQSVASTLKSGGLSDAAVAGFLGNFHVEAGYGGAQGDGGSAGGIAQWRNERRQNFVKQFGIDPTKATPEQQAKFVLWELNNPAAAGMTAQQVAAIKNARTPEEAAALIDQHYERSDGKARGTRISAAAQIAGVMTGSKTNTASAADYVGENFGNSIPEKLSALSNQNDVNARQVAVTMAKSYNLDTDWTETAINRLVARSRERGDGKRPINAAMAGQILQDTIQSRSQEGWLSWLRPDLHIAGKNTFSFNPGSLGNGMSYNIEAAEKAVDGWVAGNVDKVAAKNEGRRAAATQEAMYKQQAQALQQRINARIEAATRRGVRTDVSADVAKLNELLRLAGESTEGRGYFTQDPVGDPAPPRVPAPRTSVPKPPAVTRAPSAPRSEAFKTDNRGQYVDHSSAASRSRASAMLDNALMAINPVYWLGRAIDGK